MVKQKIFLSTAMGLCLSFCLICTTTPALADGFFVDYELAQGDGDPDEVVPQEKQNTSENEETDDEDVATITAEGDFLAPTFLLPVQEEAPVSASKTTGILADEKSSETVTTTTTTITTTTTTSQDLPIYNVSQNKVVETSEKQKTDKPTVAPVSKTTDNADVASKTVVTTENKTAQKIVPTPITPVGVEPTLPVREARNIGSGYVNRTIAPVPLDKAVKPATPADPTPQPVETVQKPIEKTRPILIPLAELPKVAQKEPDIETPTRKIIPSEYADRMLSAVSANTRPDFIMPQEIKVSFYKDATAFSGQTIKWIKAFSLTALNDPRLIVQIRLSSCSPDIQYKRLQIVKNTLIGNGLSPHQIQIVTTNRPADSLILRTIEKPEHARQSLIKSSSGRRVEKRTTKW
ncbi:MAG: hypothetical protein IKY98_05795 [Alphaproteobacteria bacterium]|nr:hypothetical protein [Alphaproteobacteria bacterium]